jgi:hypothetical protein
MPNLLDVSKWRIFLQVLPFSILFGIVKYLCHFWGWEPWQFDSFTSALFATATFVTALVLNGTLSDYRNSESIPSLIVNSLTEIQDCSRLFSQTNGSYSSLPVEQQLRGVALSIVDWLKGHRTIDELYTNLDKLNLALTDLANLGGASWINRPQGEIGKIRLLIATIKSSRETDFLASAYVLLLIFLAGSTLALLLIGGSIFSENLVITDLIFTAFLYLFVLIRDLDNPFEYDGSSSIDVDLSPLQSFIDRCNLA